MPDYQMPYGDFNNLPQMQQQYNDPNLAFANYNYAQNNQMIMNYGQSNLQATMQIAQNNFHNHMQTVLQGTMASAMAVYNTGQLAHEKAREALYKDQLLGNGVYALERSAIREVTWGIGLAGSDIGRALKIGGRRPEFMTTNEYQYQMQRGFHHRMDEWSDRSLEGLVAMASSATSMIPGVGIIGGMVLDQTIGKLTQPYFDRKAEQREMRMFAEIADLNKGVGTRRMSSSTANELADRFFEHDVSAGKYIPILGDVFGGRMAPDIKYKDTFKKMAELELLRDVNPNDVDKIMEQVKKTVDVIDKFAGLANTTREGILKIKGNLNQIGFNDVQQNNALATLTATSMSTGIDINQLLPAYTQYAQMGLQTGYRKATFADSAMLETASVKALQEAGVIDRSYNPASLAMQHMGIAAQYGETTLGKLARYGGGSLQKTMDYYRQAGGGDLLQGYLMQDLEYFSQNAPNADPLENFRTGAEALYKRFGKRAFALAKSPEEKRMMFDALYGFDELGQRKAAASIALEKAKREGNEENLSILNLSKNNTRSSVNLLSETDKTNQLRLNRYSNDIKSVELKESEKDEYDKTKLAYGGRVKNLYNLIVGGSKEADSVKQDLIRRYGISERFVNLMLKEEEQTRTEDNSSFTNKALMTAGVLTGTPGLIMAAAPKTTIAETKLGLDKKSMGIGQYNTYLKNRQSLMGPENKKVYDIVAKALMSNPELLSDPALLSSFGASNKDFYAVLEDAKQKGIITQDELDQVHGIDKATRSSEIRVDMVKEAMQRQTDKQQQSLSTNLQAQNYFNKVRTLYKDNKKNINFNDFMGTAESYQKQLAVLKTKEGQKQFKNDATFRDYWKYNLQTVYGDEEGDKLFRMFTDNTGQLGTIAKLFKEGDVIGFDRAAADQIAPGRGFNDDEPTKAIKDFTAVLKTLSEVLK